MEQVITEQVITNDEPLFSTLKHCLPFIITHTADLGTPVDIFARLSANAQQAFLFESVEGDARLARYSFIGFDPLLTVSFKNNFAFIKHSHTDETTKKKANNPVAFLESLLNKYLQTLEQTRSTANAAENKAIAHFTQQCQAFPFSGGFAGYMGYNAAQYFEKIPQQSIDPFSVPEGYYGLYDAAIVFDHQYKRMHILSLRGEKHVRSILAKILEPSQLEPLQLSNTALDERTIFDQVETFFTKDNNLNAVSRCQKYIKEGEAFQIVLSQRFSIPTASHPIDAYRILQATNPSPYSYYLKYSEFVYFGSSPETFLQCQNGQLLLRAIAGTRPRGKDIAEDDALSKELKSDEKEMAEHHMLVDLGRSDLGRVSQPGSVQPEEIAVIAKYSHVMHMSTAIKGQLLPGKTCFDAFQSCFPAGTVSGAPKIRAMQLLCQLEPEARGIYAGAVGYFDLYGNMDSAIAIRSALVKNNMAHVNAGGGIVYDSDPESEYQETRNKAKSVLQAIKLAEALDK